MAPRTRTRLNLAMGEKQKNKKKQQHKKSPQTKLRRPSKPSQMRSRRAHPHRSLSPPICRRAAASLVTASVGKSIGNGRRCQGLRICRHVSDVLHLFFFFAGGIIKRGSGLLEEREAGVRRLDEWRANACSCQLCSLQLLENVRQIFTSWKNTIKKKNLKKYSGGCFGIRLVSLSRRVHCFVQCVIIADLETLKWRWKGQRLVGVAPLINGSTELSRVHGYRFSAGNFSLTLPSGCLSNKARRLLTHDETSPPSLAQSVLHSPSPSFQPPRSIPCTPPAFQLSNHM